MIKAVEHLPPARYNINRKAAFMADHRKETLEEAEKKVFDYDPSDEELEKLYGKDFNDWCKDLIKDKLNK